MRFTLIASVTAMVLPFALAAPTGVVDKRVINCFVAPCPDDEGEFSILPFDPKPTPGPDAPVINCIRAPCDVGPISPLPIDDNEDESPEDPDQIFSILPFNPSPTLGVEDPAVAKRFFRVKPTTVA